MVKNGLVEEVRVQTGLRTSEKVQLISGVAPGDTVLTTGILQANPGSEVEITKLTMGSNL
jgi:membrane fusion protein (multidrug efflux system)